MLSFFDWGYKNGAARPRASTTCRSRENVYDLVESDVWKNVTVGGTPVWQ